MLKDSGACKLQSEIICLEIPNEQRQKTTLVSRNITVQGRRTSIRLEPEMWDALYDIAGREGTCIHNICSLVQLCKVRQSSLTAAIRVFLLLYYRAATTEEGHIKARHGSFETMKTRARVREDRLRLVRAVSQVGAK